jgi:hypothetical protein
MKITPVLVLSILSICSSAFATPVPKDGGIELVSSKHKNLFIFKADRKLIGADIKILDETSEVITQLKLKKKKLVIDFCEVKHGSYFIMVSKGETIQEFHFEKK